MLKHRQAAVQAPQRPATHRRHPRLLKGPRCLQSRLLPLVLATFDALALPVEGLQTTTALGPKQVPRALNTAEQLRSHTSGRTLHAARASIAAVRETAIA